MTPQPEFAPAASLDDRGIIDALADLREPHAEHVLQPKHVERAIAELEAEAARRGLALPAVSEVIPPAVAVGRFLAACERDDVGAMERAIRFLDSAGMWRAYLRVQSYYEPQVRAYLLQRILYHTERRVCDEERARRRQVRLTQASALTDEEYEAYLVHCIDALFIVLAINHQLPY
jgi:hypothetical protein